MVSKASLQSSNNPQSSQSKNRNSSSNNGSSPMKSSFKKKKSKRRHASKKGSSSSSIGTQSTASTSANDPSTSCRSIDVSSFKSSISSLPSPSLASPRTQNFGSIRSSLSSFQSPQTHFGSVKSSLSSLTVSPQILQQYPQHAVEMLAPLNDTGSPVRHKRGSNSSLKSTSSRGSCTSSGESSLSSFLSVLLEDEEAEPSEISIVSDNPKPEQRRIRELRRSLVRSAYKNDKPKKCRWDYLTRDNNDRAELASYKRRTGLEGRRSLSMTDALDGAKGKLRLPKRSSNDSLKDSTNDVYSTLNGKKSTDGMFLRMPVRKTSPTSTGSKNKSLVSRVNMSDTELLRLPLQEPSKISTPKKSKKKKDKSSSRRRSNSSSSRRSKNSEDSNGSRSEEKPKIGNATWSKEDPVRERRKKSSNKLLDMVLETELDSGLARPPSPLPSPATASPRSASLGIKQRQLGKMSTSLLSLDDDSEAEEEEYEFEELKGATTSPPPPPKPSSFSKHSRLADSNRSLSSSASSVSKQTRSSDSSHSRKSVGASISNHSRKSVGSSSTRSSRRKNKGSNRSNGSLVNYYKGSLSSPRTLKVYTKKSVTDSPSSLRGEITPDKCDSRPPQLPTRSHNPMSPPFVSITSSSSLSPEGKRKKSFIPLSPKKSKASVAPIKSKSCPESTSSFDSPESTHSRRSLNSTHSRKSNSTYSRKSLSSSAHSRKSLSKKSTTTPPAESLTTLRIESPSKTDECPKPWKGKWFSPFEHN